MLSQINMNSIRDRQISKPTLIYNDASDLNVILVSNFNFVSENSFELSVNKGDLLKFIAKKPGGWILVKSLDKLSNCGLIPATYVEIVINDVKNPITVNWLSNDDNSISQPGTPKMASPRTPNLNNPSSPMQISTRRKDTRDLSDAITVRNSSRSKESTNPSDFKRSNSDALVSPITNKIKTNNEPFNKPFQTQQMTFTKDGDSRASFMNPYMKVKPQMKDFKSDSFNKFKPINTSLSTSDDIKPITPTSPEAHYKSTYSIQSKPELKTRNSSISSPQNPTSPISPTNTFGNMRLSNPLNVNPKATKSMSIQSPLRNSKHSSKSSPKNDRIPRDSIGTPILSSPINKSHNIDDNVIIDFNEPTYEPKSQLISISISNCLIQNDRYWYRVDLRYPNQKIMIAKFYQDFYNLHLDIFDSKNLPRLPPPIELNQTDTDSFSMILKRCNELNNYLNKLIKLDIPKVNEWLNFKNNSHSFVLNNLNSNYNETELNNKILENSVNLLYDNLKANILNGSSNLVIHLNKIELTNLNVLKSLISKQIGFNHLLISINGKYELIDLISFDFIKLVNEINLRIIN